MGGVHSNTNVSEVEAVAETNQSQTDNVVTNKLVVVLARLLEPQNQDDSLLSPVGSLEQVVELNRGLVRLVGEILVHAASVEVPDRSAAHDIHARRAEDTKVDGSVGLFHKTRLLALAEARSSRKRSQQLLHDEFTREGQNNHVEDDKGDIPFTLAIMNGHRRVRLGDGVRQEDEVVQNVGLGRVDGIGAQEDGQQDGGQNPSALDQGMANARQEASRAATLGDALTIGLLAVGASAEVSIGIAGAETGSAGGKGRGSRVAGANLTTQTAGFSSSSALVGVDFEFGAGVEEWEGFWIRHCHCARLLNLFQLDRMRGMFL